MRCLAALPFSVYTTQEELYALCVLLQWPDGLALVDTPKTKDRVFLKSRSNGNTGLSAYILETATQATDVVFSDVPSLPDNRIMFKVLDVQLEVTFDHKGIGTVQFFEDDLPF